MHLVHVFCEFISQLLYSKEFAVQALMIVWSNIEVGTACATVEKPKLNFEGCRQIAQLLKQS